MKKLFLFLFSLAIFSSLGDTTNTAESVATRTWVRGYVTNVSLVGFSITNVVSSTNAISVLVSNHVATLNWTNSPGYLLPSATNNAIFRTQDFAITNRNPPSMGQARTNGGNRATVNASIRLLNLSGTDIASMELITYNQGLTLTNRYGPITFSGVACTNNQQLIGDLQPTYVYYFTNLSTGTGTVSFNTNGYNLIEQ